MTQSHAATNSRYWRLSLNWIDGLTRQDQEMVWDALIQWCLARNAFPGGRSGEAVVLVRSAQKQLMAQLGRWLRKQPEIASFCLEELVESDTGASTTHAPRPAGKRTAADALALLEATCLYQQHLIEEFQWSVDRMPSIRERLGTLGLQEVGA